jgi:diaminopropionate ammonia-lyase
VPNGVASARIAAIKRLGAEVSRIDGGYESAVQAAARLKRPDHLMVSDTTVAEQDQTAQWVADGYATVMAEIDEERCLLGEPLPDIVFVQIGVGGLAAAVGQHFAGSAGTRMVGVEPIDAACVLASARAGRLVDAPAPHRSIMFGLNCDRPSTTTWPIVLAYFDVFLAIEDDYARRAMALFEQNGLAVGASGAAGLAGLLALSSLGPDVRESAGLSPTARVLLFATEGTTTTDDTGSARDQEEART